MTMSQTTSKVESLVLQGKQKVRAGIDIVRECEQKLGEVVLNFDEVGSL